jgi:hypothetical protein
MNYELITYILSMDSLTFIFFNHLDVSNINYYIQKNKTDHRIT